MAHTARQAVEQFHPSPYAMSEHEIALREYWANADAARFMGYVEVRAPDGGEPALQKKRAVMLFEYEGEALQEMAADEKTRYVEARLRPRQDLPGGWELVDFREMLSDEVALLPAWQCTNCLLLAAPSSDLSTCTAYWGLERDARESGDAGAGTCAWRTMP
jgi:hypothetical protein